jgi:FkbM family methyltransferase
MRHLVRAKLASLSRRVSDFPGKMRLTMALDAALRERSNSLCSESLGANFVVEGADIIEYSILWLGAYGRPVVECLLHEASAYSRRCFWDVGANIGAVCLPLAKADLGLSVHAFEPSPRALARLGMNAAANPTLKNLHVYGMALSNRRELVPFYESHTDHNSGIGSMYAETHNTQIVPILVHSVPGDAVIAEKTAPAPDLIKIDTEGWELEVIEGLGNLIDDDRPLSILWEHCLYRIEERRQPRDVIVRRLRDRGFSLFVCGERGHLSPFVDSMLDSDHDFLARRT